MTKLQPPRIVLTGGPGGGKTTAADLFRRELGDCIVVVPESATLLFSGGYPRYREPGAIRATQRAIYQVQLGLEYAQAVRYPGRTLLCDRGTIDGAAHWPGGTEDFFVDMNTTRDTEHARYDAVVFFESAAVGGIDIEGGNPARIESREEAVELDRKLCALWEAHPRFVHIGHDASFLKKITSGLRALQELTHNLNATSAAKPD